LKGCPPERCYIDNVDAWSVNEVAINWNAPLAWIASFADEKGQAAEKGIATGIAPGTTAALPIRH